MSDRTRYRQLDEARIDQTLRRLRETLVTGLSGKIWQKITLLERTTSRARG